MLMPITAAQLGCYK